jgi:colanic acid/amylovoran biosynthesis protein
MVNKTNKVSSKMKKAFLVHSVAANGGDELLLDTLTRGLRKIVNSKVSATTTNGKVSYEYIKSKCFLDDYICGYRTFENDILDRLSNKVGIKNKKYFKGGLGRIFPKVKKTRREIEKSDYVVLMPGGYINDYYGMEKILEIVKKIREMRKPIYVFGHSVGPFRSKKSKNNFRQLFKYCKKIILRERESYEYVKKLVENSANKVIVSTDIAFAYKKLMGHEETFRQNKGDKKALINFREWPYECSSEKIVSVGCSVSKAVMKKGYKATFISTCQGVEGYRDDSKVSKKIAEKLRTNDFGSSIEVVKERYRPERMIEKMKNYDVYVGMRLHGAISAMIAGVPAYNIGYEHKSRGIYKYLGISEYTKSITKKEKKIVSSVNEFLNQKESQKMEKFKHAMERGVDEALSAFKILRKEVHGD